MALIKIIENLETIKEDGTTSIMCSYEKIIEACDAIIKGIPNSVDVWRNKPLCFGKLGK